MKKLIVLSSLVIATTSFAQTKKLNIEQKMDISTSLSVMGQSMDIPATTTIFMLVDITKKSAAETDISYTTKRLKTNTNVMGQEMNYDSDDASNASMPNAEKIKEQLNKTETITLVNGKIKGKENEINTVVTNPTGPTFLETIYLLPTVATKMVGDKWTDEVKDEKGGKVVTIYSITKKNADEIEVTSNASIATNGTTQTPMGEAKQKMNGTITTISVYHTNTLLLKGQASKMDLTGTMEMMGNDMPITLKGTGTVTIKE